MTNKLEGISRWCRAGIHAYRYTENHEWCLMSIAGCDHWKCADCGKEIHTGYPEHPHEHKSPKEGARYGLR